MKIVKVFILLNIYDGWKIVKDDRKHVDCTKPLAIFKTLDEAKSYCENNHFEVIRVCN